MHESKFRMPGRPGIIPVLLVLSIMNSSLIRAQDTIYSETWELDNLDSIGGHPVSYLGDPVVVHTEIGDAIAFDGVGDQLLVDANPIGEAPEFTVEVVFWPEACYPENTAPRFVHIQDPEDPQNKRVMIELRLTPLNHCYLDGFMLTDNDNLTLVADSLTHPTETWLHAAITYKEGVFTTYVNGVEELSGQVDYQDHILDSVGKTSLGARMNENSWFRGKIRTLRVTRKALTPGEFLQMDTSSSAFTRFPEARGNLISAYPIPADHLLNIDLTACPESDFSISIMDLCGRVVRSTEVRNPVSGSFKINTTGLEDGIYLLRVRTGSGIRATRILIRHGD